MASLWYLERTGASATRVALVPKGDEDIEIDYPLPGGVFDGVGPADGETVAHRTVWSSPRQKVKITVPVLVFTSMPQAKRLVALCASGYPLTLGTDFGETYRVRAITSARLKVLGTPDRLVKPQIRVTLQLVEV